MKMKKNVFLWMAGLSFAFGGLLIGSCDEKEESDNTPTVTITPETITLTDAGGEGTFTVTSTTNWKLSFGGAQWISAYPMKGAAGETAVTLTAEPISTAESRTAVLGFVLDDGTKAGSLTVQQDIAYPDKIDYVLSAELVELADLGNMRLIRLASNAWWKLTPSTGWIHLDLDSGSPGTYYIKVSADENSGDNRTGSINLTIGDTQKTINVTQGKKGDYYNDGDVVMLHTHTVGTGFPVVILGDGFDRQDLKKGDKANPTIDSWWLYWGSKIARHFTEVDMITDLMPYIDIYLLMSESPERGVNYPTNNLTGSAQVNYIRTRTKFGAHGTEENWDVAVKTARDLVKAKSSTSNPEETSIIFMANGPYPGNASNPLARMGVDEQSYPYWAVHEFAGHIVSDMPDLYCNGQQNVNDEFRLDIDTQHSNGFYYFVDYRNDPAEVAWKDFIGGDPRHENGSGPIDTYPTCFFVFGKDKVGKDDKGNDIFEQSLWRPDKDDPMDGYYLCHGLGTRIQIFNTIMRACDPSKYNNMEEFIKVDLTRAQHECQYRQTNQDWNDYNRHGKLSKRGTYDRFWGALWPRN
jgi:hypothetical protein